MTYRALIKAIRKRTGETQQKFATRLDLSVRTVQGWERGKIPTVLLHLAALVREQAKHNLPSITTPPARGTRPTLPPPLYPSRANHGQAALSHCSVDASEEGG